MARPRKPTALLEARGSFLRHPERKRARQHEPVATGPLGSPPERLDDLTARAWNELASQLPPGVAKRADRIAFEMVAILVARLWSGKLSLDGFRVLSSLLAKFGLSPADRSRVAATPEPEGESAGLAYFRHLQETKCIN